MLTGFKIILFATGIAILRAIGIFLLGGYAVGQDIGAMQVAVFFLHRYAADVVVIGAAMALFGRIQSRRTYLGAAAVVVLQELIGYVLVIGASAWSGFDWRSTSSPFWFADYVVLILSAAVGTIIGCRWRVASESQQARVGE